MTISFTPQSGNSYVPRMLGSSGTPYSLLGTASTVEISQDDISKNALGAIDLGEGVLTLDEDTIPGVPILTITELP